MKKSKLFARLESLVNKLENLDHEIAQVSNNLDKLRDKVEAIRREAVAACIKAGDESKGSDE